MSWTIARVLSTLAISAALAWAQVNQANLSGVVTDPAGAAVGGFAAIALATRSLNAQAEVATTPLALAALLSLGAPEAPWSLPDSPPEVRSTEPQEPALSERSSTSERDLRQAPPVVAKQSAKPFPIKEWEPSRRALVRTAPAPVKK